MALRLEWDDLLITNIAEQDYRVWLGYWSGWLSMPVLPLSMSKFGDWFLRHPDGSTSELSVLEGTYEKIAGTPDEFSGLLNSQRWQEEHLLSLHILRLHERGLVPSPRECYGLAPHPLLAGRIDMDGVMIMPIGAWQSICAQTHGSRPKAAD